MGYSSIAVLLGIMLVSAYIVLHAVSFSNTVITAAVAALFTDVLGLIVSIWKIVIKPDFVTRLAPITQLEESEAAFFQRPSAESPKTNKDNLVILSARYGVHNRWMDVAPLLRAKIQDGKLHLRVTNEELGGDPFPLVKYRALRL